jgi:SAM-dependent methyltransferase
MIDSSEKEGTSTPPLYQQRPPKVKEAIEERYASASEGRWRGYSRQGEARQPHLIGHAEVSTDEIIEALRRRTPSRPVEILDIGTGYGGFLKHTQKKFGQGVALHGLNAPDFASRKQRLSQFNHQIGNAENLRDIYPSESFDLVVSSATVLHLVDPLGAITQMYEALKPDGILAIDGDFRPLGVQEKFPALIKWLNSQGYPAAADFKYQLDGESLRVKGVKTLVVRKTHPSLRLPVKYEGVRSVTTSPETAAEYSLTEKLPTRERRVFPEIRRFVAETTPPFHTLLRERLNTNPPPGQLTDATQTEMKDWARVLERKSASPEKISEIKKVGKLLVETTGAWLKRREQKSRKGIQRVLATKV